MEDKDAVQKVKKLLERQKKAIDLDREHFKISKNIASGNGISKADIEAYGNERAIVNMPILDPAVNSICHRFDTNPFAFAFPSEYPSLCDEKELAAVLSKALREICWDGISYVLIYHAADKIKLRVLDNLNTVYGKCKLADGSDCREALYIDKISEHEIKKQYPGFYIENGTIGGVEYSGVARQDGEYEEATYWEQTDKAVKVSKFIGGRLAEEAELPITRIPIVRITGKRVLTEGMDNWRGLPYAVRGLLTTLTYCASLLQERIATAPTFNFWVAAESAPDQESAKQMANLNGFPRACGYYRAFDSGNALPVPARVDKSAGIEELSAHIADLTQTINAIAGSVSAAPPAAGTETAESVLLRRESKDTATDEFLRNLLTGAQSIAAVIKEFYGMFGLPAAEITVSESIFEKAKEMADGQKLTAYVGFFGQNQHMMDFANVLLDTLDLKAESAERVRAVLAERKQKEESGQQQMMQQLQEQNAQSAQALQQAQAESQELNARLAFAQKQIQDLQFANFEMQSDSKAKILIEEMKLKNQMAIKQLEIDLEYAKLGLKAEDAAESNRLKAAELLARQQTEIDASMQEAQEHPTDGGYR